MRRSLRAEASLLNRTLGGAKEFAVGHAKAGKAFAPAIAAIGLAAGLAGCNPAGYPTCFRIECPYPPVYHDSYAGYIPAYVPGATAFYDPPWDDPSADYTQRIVTVSPSAGNAQAANLALQTATPWPRYSSNTSIPGNGARSVNAIHNYESGPPPSAGGGGGGGGAGGVTGGH